jgi:hypothetical protein
LKSTKFYLSKFLQSNLNFFLENYDKILYLIKLHGYKLSIAKFIFLVSISTHERYFILLYYRINYNE